MNLTKLIRPLLLPFTVLNWQAESEELRCSRQSGEFLCELPYLGFGGLPDQSVNITLTGVSTATGTLEISVSATADGAVDDNCESGFPDSDVYLSIVEPGDVELDISANTEELFIEPGDKELISTFIYNSPLSTAQSVYLDVVTEGNLSAQFIDGCLQSQIVDTSTLSTETSDTSKGLVHRCELGDVPPFEFVEVSLEVTATDESNDISAENTELRFIVSSSRPDYTEHNNEIHIDINPSETIVDLELTVVGSSEITEINPGEEIPLLIEVKNNSLVSAAIAPKIRYVENLFELAFYIESDQCSEFVVSPRFIENICELADIPPGESVLVSGNASPLTASAMMFVLPFNVFSDNTDPEPDNNKIRKVYSIQPSSSPQSDTTLQSEVPVHATLQSDAFVDATSNLSDGGGGGSMNVLVLFVLLWFCICCLALRRIVASKH